MKQEDRLNIQAWLDGEIDPQKSDKIAELVETNAKAKAVAKELKAVESTLKIGEKPVFLDDSREFYWSQIYRQINACDRMSNSENLPKLVPTSSDNLLRWLIPVGSLAAIFALMVNFDKIKSGGPVQSLDDDPTTLPSGLSEPDGIFEDEHMEAGVGIFNFEISGESRNFPDVHDSNTLPESIENPER